MIRRKLTRIEVTLDDTKDLDEYFSRASNNSIALSGLAPVVGTSGATATTPACSTKTPSQLYQLYTKNYTVTAFVGSHPPNLDFSIDQQQSSSTALGISSSAHQPRSFVENSNYPNDSIGNLVTNSTTSDQQQQQTSDSDPLRYNPQPHNQFSRFNQNI